MSTQAMTFINDAKGFTLIELIAVMVILGVMASVAVKKFHLISDTAGDRALQEVIKELNVRETVTWTKTKWTSTGWTNDADLFTLMDTHLGTNFVWTAGPGPAGGTIKFKSSTMVLIRTPSTTSSIGRWNST